MRRRPFTENYLGPLEGERSQWKSWVLLIVFAGVVLFFGNENFREMIVAEREEEFILFDKENNLIEILPADDSAEARRQVREFLALAKREQLQTITASRKRIVPSPEEKIVCAVRIASRGGHSVSCFGETQDRIPILDGVIGQIRIFYWRRYPQGG